MRIVLSLLILCLSLSIGLSQNQHIAVFPDLSDQELLSKLLEDYKTSTVLSYADARDAMYSEIYNEDDYVSGIYTNHTLYLDPTAQPREFLYMNGDQDGINCEHTFPRSKGADFGNPKSDIHHLFPTRSFVNNARSSKPFAEINDTETDFWFYQDQAINSIPTNNIDDYSEDDTDAFEPRESVKGNVARAMMYFYTMYKSEADNADAQFFSNQVETLCNWHFDDPVDSMEYSRTWLIANYQEGKPNPFVLDCSVAARTYCDMISTECMTLPSKELETAYISMFPNPSLNHLNFEITGIDANVSIEIFDGLRRVDAKQFKTNQRYNYRHNLASGYYLCRFSINGDLFYKSFVITK